MPPINDELKIVVATMHAKIEAMEKSIDKLVTQIEFVPVKLVVYGMVAIITATALGGFLLKIFIK